MSPESIITSADSEKRWLRAMAANLNPLYIVDMPSCVFKVPKKLTDAKPEAYAPRRLGLGPLHHLRPDFHAINKRKLVALCKFYTPEKLQHIRFLVGYLIKLEPVIRACYDQFLDLDIETLAWIIAVDGLYLLQFLKNYREMKDVAGDVLMLENQIPLELLTAVRRVFKLISAGDESLFKNFEAFFEGRSPLELGPTDDELLLKDFRPFLRDQSPLELYPRVEETNCAHLLHQMYSMILSNRVGVLLTPQNRIAPQSFTISLNDVAQGTAFLAERGVPGAGTASQVLSFASAIPWEKISGMFKKDGPDPSITADEIDIPSVTQMAEIAGIKFVRTEGGIRDVRFDDGGGESTAEKKFYLPWIKITATTEIVLRNLVAFEELVAAETGGTLELAEYVDLMCGIIDTRRDVEILREARIVRGEMADDEIARIFNGINRSEKTKEKKEERSGVEEAVEGVNARYNSLQRVKLKKLAGKYGRGCLTVMSVAAAIAVVVLLTLQAYCSVFGCSRWFGKSSG